MANSSSAVISSDDATALQYNNLRLDAIGPYLDERVWNDNIKARFGTLGADGDIYSDGSGLKLDATSISGTAILDEDDMSSDSAIKLATQQSIKAYVDTQVAAGDHTKYLDSEAVAAVEAAGLSTPALGTPSALVGTNISGTAAGLTAGNVTTNANLTGHVTSVGNAAVLGSFTKAQLSAAVSNGTPLYSGDITIYTDAEAISAVEGEATLALASGATIDGNVAATVANHLGAFAATTSAQLAAVISNETGSGLLVFGTSPTLVTPALGTPSALVGTNISGTASALTAGNVTTNANLTGHVTSTGNAAVLGSFTKAQLSAAVSDGTPLYSGDITIYTDAEAIAAVEGEATLVLQLGAIIGATGTNTAHADADDLVIDAGSSAGITLLGTDYGRIYFGDASDPRIGRIEFRHVNNTFYIRPEGNETLVISGSGVKIYDGHDLIVGYNQTITLAGTTPAYEQIAATSADGIMANAMWNTSSYARYAFLRSRGNKASLTDTIVTGDVLGAMSWYGADGTDLTTKSAEIKVSSIGTIAGNRIPSIMEFFTGTDESTTAVTLALTLDKIQNAIFERQIVQKTTPDADHEAAGGSLVIDGTLGGTVTLGEVGYIDSAGKIQRAVMTSASTMPAKYLVMESGVADDPVKLLRNGVFKDASWATLTIGGEVYVSTAGTLTQTRPSTSGDQVQIVGYAIAADTIDFDFNSTTVGVA